MAGPAATSVLVPAHNEATAIGEVVAGLAQAGSWHEILVIDDGSTDATSEVARAAGARTPCGSVEPRGATTPIEITYLSASSTVMSSSRTRDFGTMMK